MKKFDSYSRLTARVLLLLAGWCLSMNAIAWTKELNFNDGTAGQKAENSSDSFDSAAGLSFYSTAQSAEGGMSAELNIRAGETAFGLWGGIISHPTKLRKGDEIWVRVKTYMPEGFDYGSYSAGGRLKFLRVHTKSDSVGNYGYNDWYISGKNSSEVFGFIYEGEQYWSWFGSNADRPVLGKWETYEMYLKFDDVPVSKGGQARIRVWKNGKLLKDITDRKTLVNSSAYAEGTYLFTYWNGGAPKTQKMWVDDIVVTSDRPSRRDAQGNPFVGTGVGFSGEPTASPAEKSPPTPPVIKN